MEIGELLINLGVKTETTKLRDFIHDLGDLNLSSIVAASSFGGLLDGIKNIMEAANRLALPLNNFHALTGLSSQELQAWDLAAQKAGLSSGLVASTVDNLQNSIENLIRTGEGGTFYAAFQIDPTKTKDTFATLRAILQYLDQHYHNDQASQKWMLQHFGLPEQLVQMVPLLDTVDTSYTSSQKSLDLMAQSWVQIKELGQVFSILLTDIGAILQNSFVGSLLKGLEAIVKFVDQAQILYPLLGAITGVLGAMALRMAWVGAGAFFAALPALLANPLALAGLVGAVGLGTYGLMQGNTDNSRDITMHNYNTFHGDSAQNNMKAYDDWYQEKLQTASDQTPFENY